MDNASEYGGTAGLIQRSPHEPTEAGDRLSVREAATLRRAGLRAGALASGTVPDPADTIGP